MENKNNIREIKQLIQDVAMLKEILLSTVHRNDSEGELSDWANEELKIARKIPISEFISLEEVKNRILKR